MIYLPNSIAAPKKEITRDIHRLADWVELSCLYEDDGEVSSDDIKEAFDSSGLFEGNDGEDKEKLDNIDCAVEDIFRTLRSRERKMSLAYPFSLEKSLITRKGAWTDSRCYSALLVSDMLRFYDYGLKDSDFKGAKFTYLFEKIVEACAGSVFHTKAVRFGWPRDEHLGWPTSIQERIEKLCEMMNVAAKDTDREQGRDKDIGLDVVVRIELGDGLPGQLIILIQCATGQNWTGKTGEPSVELWKSIVDWRARVVRGIAFPWRIDVTERELARHSDLFEAMIFDRHRLLSGRNPDQLLDPRCLARLDTWCDHNFDRIAAAQTHT